MAPSAALIVRCAIALEKVRHCRDKDGWIVAVLAESLKGAGGKHLHFQSIHENDRRCAICFSPAMPGADHSCVRPESDDSGEYRPRNPEDSLLYRTIAGHLETFLARQQERGREVPAFVEREMRAYLSCGVLACGFLRLKCESCGKERLLPLSCKGRSVCPSCCGRRMADTAAHLLDRVFPHVPVRQWVLSLPFALRYRLAYDSEMVTAVLQVFIRALFGLYRRMARDYGINKTQCGTVTFVQRFGSAANLNLHFHVLCIDGIYAPGLDGKPQFFALRPPENCEVRELAELLSKRIPALLRRRGVDTPQSGAEESDRLTREQPWLSEVYAASVCGRIATGPEAGRRVAVGGDRVDPEGIDSSSGPRCAAVAGFSLHANVCISPRDRLRLERLCRLCRRLHNRHYADPRVMRTSLTLSPGKRRWCDDSDYPRKWKLSA